MTNTIQISTPNIRFNKQEKGYYTNLLRSFANIFDSDKIKYIEFGKQDIRGAVCITLFNEQHTVNRQQHFSSKQEMMAYIEGFLDAVGHNQFSTYQL